MEPVKINTASELKKQGNLISLFTYYVSGAFIKSFISNVKESVNGTEFMEGEEGFIISGYDAYFYIDDNGDLIVKSDDSLNFYIDDDGNLKMEY